MKNPIKKTLSHVIAEVIRLNALQKMGEIAPDQLAVLVKHSDPYLSEHIMEMRELLSTLSSINEMDLLFPESSPLIDVPSKNSYPMPITTQKVIKYINSLPKHFKIPLSDDSIPDESCLYSVGGVPKKHFKNLIEIRREIVKRGGRVLTTATQNVDYHVLLKPSHSKDIWQRFGQVVSRHLYYLSTNQSSVKFITEEHLLSEMKRHDSRKNHSTKY